LPDAIGATGGFVNVSAEKIGGLGASHPFTEDRAAAVFSGHEFIEFRIEGREMHDEMKRFNSIKCPKSLADFFFGIFSGSVEWRDVAIADRKSVV
jgi:hypothetical protein